MRIFGVDGGVQVQGHEAFAAVATKLMNVTVVRRTHRVCRQPPGVLIQNRCTGQAKPRFDALASQHPKGALGTRMIVNRTELAWHQTQKKCFVACGAPESQPCVLEGVEADIRFQQLS